MVGYERIKSLASSFGLRESLAQLWALSTHIVYGQDLPPGYGGADYRDHAGSAPGKIREFHLDLYAREILMHAGPSGTARRSLRMHRDLRVFHNAILKYGDQHSGGKEELYLTLHRLSLEQMPHFDRADWAYLGRYSLLLKHTAMSQLYESVFGLTSFDYIRFTSGLFTLYFHRPECRPIEELAILQLKRTAVETCLHRMQATATQIRNRMRANMRHTSSWQYTFNGLVSTPLIQLPGSQLGSLFCPRPSLLLKRMMAGSLFDLYKADSTGYSKAVGAGVDEAVGAVCTKVTGVAPVKPEHYGPKHRRRAGVDWIIADDSACLYIECKATQISKNARTAASIDELRMGLRHLASAVAQNAENIHDVMEGRTGWAPGDRSAFSLVVTLEDWVIFSPVAVTEVRKLSEHQLQSKNLNPDLLDRYPFTIISLAELPNLLAAIAKEGIEAVFRSKASDRYSNHMMSAFLRDSGRDSGAARNLYEAIGNQVFLEVLGTMDEARRMTVAAKLDKA